MLAKVIGQQILSEYNFNVALKKRKESQLSEKIVSVISQIKDLVPNLKKLNDYLKNPMASGFLLEEILELCTLIFTTLEVLVKVNTLFYFIRINSREKIRDFTKMKSHILNTLINPCSVNILISFTIIWQRLNLLTLISKKMYTF